MLYALVSDIHANLRAWYAVLDDMEDFGPDAILCLGDVVGYGPMPGEVLESVCEYVDEIVIGNHDAVVAGRYSPESFNDNARRVIDWTRDQLGDDVIEFFADLPADLDGDNFTLAHAELGDPERFDYIEDEEMARESLGSCDSDLVFVGHTHHAGIFVWDLAVDRILRHDPTDFAALQDMRYIVNVGSVGDPRTDDLRASYCLYDSDLREVFFRQVPWDVDEYRLDVQDSSIPMPPFCLTIDEDLEEYRSVVIERPTIVVTREKRPRLRISRGAISAAAGTDPEAELALERLEMQAEEERRKKREAMQQSLTESLKVSRKRHQETVEKLKALHAKKRREAEARAEAERLEREREEREREERAREKKKELAQTVAARARQSRERQQKRKKEERAKARRAIEQKRKAAEERRKQEEEEKARLEAEATAKKAVLAEKRRLAEEKRRLEAEKRAVAQQHTEQPPARKTTSNAVRAVVVNNDDTETSVDNAVHIEADPILAEKQKLEEEKRKIEEEKRRLAEEKRLIEEKRKIEEEKRKLEEEKRKIEEERKKMAAPATPAEPGLPVAQPAQVDKTKTAKLVLPTAAKAPTPAVPAAPVPAIPLPAVPAGPARTVSETAAIDEVEEEPPADDTPQAVDLLQQINTEEVDPETARKMRLKTIREAAEAKEAARKRNLAEKKAAREAQRAAAREAIRKKQEAARRKREAAEADE